MGGGCKTYLTSNETFFNDACLQGTLSYCFKKFYSMFFAKVRCVKGFATIASLREASVVVKPFTIRTAFTLAEVLIVLGIIGLIADMTIPTLHQNIQIKVNVTRLQKAYSTFESALRLAISENGTPDEWGIPIGGDEDESARIFISKIETYLSMTKNCSKDGGRCWFDVKYLDGTSGGTSTERPKKRFILSDGTAVNIAVHSPLCKANFGSSITLQNVCASADIDINGSKGPNQMGRDVFTFWFTKYGVLPLGTPADTSGYRFDQTCKYRTNQKGYGCAAWVIYKGNMDYLTCQGAQCDDLKW